MDYTLKTIATPEQRKIIFTLAKGAGVKVYFSGGNWQLLDKIEDAVNEYPSEGDNKYLLLDDNGIQSRGSIDNIVDGLVSFEQFLQHIITFNEMYFTQVLNDRYSAVVNTKTGDVVVGCQTFRIETLIKLVDKYKAAKKS